LLNGIDFLSPKYRIFKQKTTGEILRFCNRKKSNGETVKESIDKKGDPIKRRKRQYQKLETDGFELLISTPGVFIGKTRKGISVKEKGVMKYQAPLLNLKHITILSQGVTISSNVIRQCAESKIPVDFVGFDGKPYAKIYAFQPGSIDIELAQLEAIENGKAPTLAKRIVQGKIRNQINLVKYYSKYRINRDKDFTDIFEENIGHMESLIKDIRSIPEKDLEILRGKLFSIEGRAASCYWNMVESILNESVDFEGRIRRGATDLVNSLLNYGYGILYSRIWEAVLFAKLSPYISYLHKPQTGRPSLIFDLIEEFRQQAVDKAIFPLITKGEPLKVEGGRLTNDTKKRVVDAIFKRLHKVEMFRGKEMRLSEIIKHQSKALADFLTGKTKSYRCYVGKW